MNKELHEVLVFLRQETLKDIKFTNKIIKGSLVKLHRKCGKKNCHCHKGEKHASLYLSQSINSKTQMTYIPKKYEKDITEYVNTYKKIQNILNKITGINLKIFKNKFTK